MQIAGKDTLRSLRGLGRLLKELRQQCKVGWRLYFRRLKGRNRISSKEILHHSGSCPHSWRSLLGRLWGDRCAVGCVNGPTGCGRSTPFRTERAAAVHLSSGTETPRRNWSEQKSGAGNNRDDCNIRWSRQTMLAKKPVVQLLPIIRYGKIIYCSFRRDNSDFSIVHPIPPAKTFHSCRQIPNFVVPISL